MKLWVQRAWERFRSWPTWLQWTIGILVGLIVIGALTDTRDDKQTVSSSRATTTFSFLPTMPSTTRTTSTTSTTTPPTTATPTTPPPTPPPTPAPTAAPRTTAAPTGPRTTFGPGQYRVGIDIAPGTYVAPGGSVCYWERQATFAGGFDDMIENELSTEGQVVATIAETDAGFKSSGCGTWVPG